MTERQPEHLPKDLRAAVGEVVGVLGEVVKEAAGEGLYEAVEQIRRDMVAVRDAHEPEERRRLLATAEGRLAELSPLEKRRVARAFTLYLELVNVCENAYRSHRLLERGRRDVGPGRAELTFVLTAHPTESRSPENIRLLRRAQVMITRALQEDRPLDDAALENLLHLAWRVGTHPPHKPSVEDEARHLFSLLTDPVLAEVAALTARGHHLRFHTWVGGDKDGHPGVGAVQTRRSLGLSRERLIDFVRTMLLPPLREDTRMSRSDVVASALDGLDEALWSLASLSDGDGAHVRELHAAVERYQRVYAERVGARQPELERLGHLLTIFPALVVPLELREERGHFGRNDPIADMLRALRDVARGGKLDWYVSGCVVSMTCESEDLLEAARCVRDIVEDAVLPVIPLFELPEVLLRATTILDEAWRDDGFRQRIEAKGHLEVMLGYSDTAKRMGMLASRVRIHETMRGVAEWAAPLGVTPVFFHGHGGSVGRGGGRIEDLIATWPPAARNPYKYTLQGEMVERTLATPEILRSLVLKVAEVQHDPPPYRPVGALTKELAEASAKRFSEVVATPAFRDLLGSATPYARLQALTIGSRPVARKAESGGASLEKLRAIPWVLCWTQTRLLLHAWLGVGEVWRERTDHEEALERLRRARDEDPLLYSYLRLLSFTLAKTEPEIWRRYHETLAPASSRELIAELDASLA
ncbi:MAG: phosphoenolpyruvate carboxylase, partial [Myxococcales bacterium]|nr:phosphoenolpyruvate carboxylase [Myxococcales bacterium]